MSGQTEHCRVSVGDALSTAAAQGRLQQEMRAFSNAMAKAAIQNATASFEAAKAASLANVPATLSTSANQE